MISLWSVGFGRIVSKLYYIYWNCSLSSSHRNGNVFRMIPCSSLETSMASFNVHSDDQGSHPDDISVSVANSYSILWFSDFCGLSSVARFWWDFESIVNLSKLESHSPVICQLIIKVFSVVNDVTTNQTWNIKHVASKMTSYFPHLIHNLPAMQYNHRSWSTFIRWASSLSIGDISSWRSKEHISMHILWKWSWF